MPEVVQSLTDSEMDLFEIVSVPSVFSEFVRSAPDDPPHRQWVTWPQQIREMNIESLHKKRFQGRNLGKSITCMDEMNSMVLLYDGNEDGVALIGTRADLNLNPIFKSQVSLWQNNRFLKHFLIADKKRAIDRKNKEIRLFRDNRMTIQGRIQGKDGQGFNTVHPNVCAWIDEAQYIDDLAIAEFYGMISGDLPLMASGVPNGWRMSWAYKIDTDPSRGFTGGKMTRLEDPRAIDNPAWVEQLKQTYGGEDSNLYKQKVLGQWGTASTMTFNPDLITIDQDEGPPPYYKTYNIDYGNYKTRTDLASIMTVAAWMPEGQIGDVIIHADEGITSGSTGYCSFYDKKAKAWRQAFRFIIHGMQTPEQVDIFDYIARIVWRLTKIKPLIAIDTTGGGGKAIASFLEQAKWDVFRADFNVSVKWEKRPETQEEINKRLEKDPWDNPAPRLVDQEIVLKQVAIPRMATEMYAGRLWIINDEDIIGQINSTSNHENARGQQVYETDYTKDEKPLYNHDLQAFEVLGAVLHEREYSVKPVASPEVWVQPVDIGWGQDDPYAPYRNGLE
jgi:hypothetical protein